MAAALKSSEFPHAVLPNLDPKMIYNVHSKSYSSEGANKDEEETVRMIFSEAMQTGIKNDNYRQERQAKQKEIFHEILIGLKFKEPESFGWKACKSIRRN